MQGIKTVVWRYRGSLLVLIVTTFLTLGALRWMGYDLNQLPETFIGDGGDAYNNS